LVKSPVVVAAVVVTDGQIVEAETTLTRMTWAMRRRTHVDVII